jgi:glycosyltransferase involved in cell wall biosynthesis
MTEPQAPATSPSVAPEPISVLLPAFNQQADVEAVVAAWVKHLGSLGRDFEVILIDDGSTDQTATLTEGLAARHSQVHRLRHETHRGFGAALRTGLAAVRHPLVCYTTCDTQYQPADLDVLLKELAKEDPWTGDQVKMVAGCRVSSTGVVYRTRWWLRWLARLLFGVHMHDLGCLYLVAQRSLFARIPIQSAGPFAHVEILAKANFLGCLMTETKVTYRPKTPEEAQSKEARRQLLADAHRVFHQPDFGPAFLPEQATATVSVDQNAPLGPG